MLGRSHRFLGITSTFWGVNKPCSRTQHGLTQAGLEPPTSGSGVRGINHQATALPSDLFVYFQKILWCRTERKKCLKCDIFIYICMQGSRNFELKIGLDSRVTKYPPPPPPKKKQKKKQTNKKTRSRKLLTS